MNTIRQRAEEYARRIEEENRDAYIFTDAEVLVEEAYEAGAKEERQRLTAWHNPLKVLPKHTTVVLVKLEEHYVVCLWSSDAKRFLQPNGYIYSPEGIDAWRPIHDNNTFANEL